MGADQIFREPPQSRIDHYRLNLEASVIFKYLDKIGNHNIVIFKIKKNYRLKKKFFF